MLDLRRLSEFWAISVAFSGGTDCSLLDLGLSLPPLSEVPVAGFCDCAAMSLREALPRFLRSRLYSHVRPNSICHDALAWLAACRLGMVECGQVVNIPTQCAQGVLPSHFVRSWLHWSHARLILRRTGAPLLLPLLPAL